ncbi:MAG TPA: hypothetical protein VLQ89_06750 [Candidatus Binatia bacterium]|nr:hypothetical protein [Candidatus Binatia bacterium]
MPAVSFYLKKEVLDAVRARASAKNMPISRIISRAVEEFLGTAEMDDARKRVMARIGKTFGKTDWETLHRERTAADADRD